MTKLLWKWNRSVKLTNSKKKKKKPSLSFLFCTVQHRWLPLWLLHLSLQLVILAVSIWGNWIKWIEINVLQQNNQQACRCLPPGLIVLFQLSRNTINNNKITPHFTQPAMSQQIFLKHHTLVEVCIFLPLFIFVLSELRVVMHNCFQMDK